MSLDPGSIVEKLKGLLSAKAETGSGTFVLKAASAIVSMVPRLFQSKSQQTKWNLKRFE